MEVEEIKEITDYSFSYSSFPSNFFDSETFLTALLKSSWLTESR